MRRLPRTPLLVAMCLGLTVGGCESSVNGSRVPVERELELRKVGLVAVSATVNVYVAVRCVQACDDPGDVDVVIERATVDDPTLFDVQTSEDGRGTLALHALREGTTTLRVTARGGELRKDFTTTLDARSPDKLTIEGECRDARGLLVGTNTDVHLLTKLFHQDTILSGSPVPYPVVLTNGLTGLAVSALAIGIMLDPSPVAASGTVQSALDPADAVAVRIVDKVTQITLEPPTTAARLDGRLLVERGGKLTLGINLYADNQRLCRDRFERKVVVDTPATCEAQIANGELLVFGVESGTCTVGVTVGATTGKVALEIRKVE